MATTALNATVRKETGKGVARKLRRDGFVPAVMYGVGEPTSLAISARELNRVMVREGGDHGLIELNIDGDKKGVILRNHQVDALTGVMTHCDFYEVQKGHKVTVSVSITLTGGDPVGVREEQGIVQHMMHEIELDCLPSDIPETLELDVSALHVGDSLHVSDLNVPEGAHLHAAEDATVISVLAPRVEAEPVAAEAAEEGGEAAAESEGGGEAGEGESSGE